MRHHDVIAITGAIGSGKTTLARRVAQAYGAVYIGSDDVRASLSHKQQRSGARVFEELQRRLEDALAKEQRVVLDSTAMSPRFRAILGAYRVRIFHVHLQLHREEWFEQRERTRSDRPDGPLPRAAFHRSRRVTFAQAPDLIIATDELTPAAVVALLAPAMSPWGPIDVRDT